jgi:CHAD domain-containing protein
MKETLEREIKLSPEEGFVLPELGGRRLPTRVFISTYHDTPDLRLARNGVTFRHRVEDGTGLWQLKLPRDAARLELEQPGPPARPPGEMLALLPAFLRGAELVPVARLRTRREGVRAHGAEIVDDSVAVLEGQHVARRFREVEVELLDGDERTLRRLEKELRRAGAHATGALQPKLYRALDLAGAVETREATKTTPPGEALGIAFENEYRAVLNHDPGTRRGDDAEHLHQLRVATRRLRAFLRAARPLLDETWSEPLREELGWLGGHLGPARDLDVMLERLGAEIDGLGGDGEAATSLLDTLEEERATAYRDVVETLEGERYLALLDRLEGAAAPPLSGDDRPLAKIFAREAKRMRKAFAELGDEPEDDELHAARIKVKRARYAADLAAHELGGAGSDFVAIAKKMQDLLGDHQDAVVAQGRIRDWAATAFTPEAGFAAGRLIQLERDRMTAARAQWPALWKKLDRAARRAAS